MIAYLLAGLSAIFAALVAIFGKLGVANVDPTVAATVRAVIMAIVLVVATIALRKLDLAGIGGREWLWILLAGLAGAASWLFYFWALKEGDATAVAAIDRLSIVFVAVLAALFLGEALSFWGGFGIALIALGALLVAFF